MSLIKTFPAIITFTVLNVILVLCSGCSRPESTASNIVEPERSSSARDRILQRVDLQPEMQNVSGHQQMRSVLAGIKANCDIDNDFVGNGYVNRLQTILSAPDLKENSSPIEIWEFHLKLGRAELILGHEDRAVEILQNALELLPEGFPRQEKLNHFELGLAMLRFGETQNCCQRNNSDSCIVPIRGQGIHVKPFGSRTAIAHFMKVLSLEADPNDEYDVLYYDKTSRWLLNIAYMTLGEYPDGVPQEHLVDPSFFASDVEFPRFINVYPKLGLNTFNLCGGAAVDDFDNDGDMDIVTCTWDITGQTQVFSNHGDGTFDEVTSAAGLDGFYGGLNLVHADYDNDGDLDVFVMRGAWLGKAGLHPNSLLRNDGNLKFTDVTFDVGLERDNVPTKTAAWADYDNDGDLDLYVGNESDDAVSTASRLYRNNGDGTFSSVGAEAGVEDWVFSMGAAWGDYDNDRFPDLFLSIGGQNKLYHNNRDGTFTDVAKELGVLAPDASFPTWFFDYDNDGRLDIFVGCTSGVVGVFASDIRFEMMHLYHNNGTFTDVAQEYGLHYPASPMGANYGDLNNDGFPDFYLATGNTKYSEIQPNVMFLNQKGQSFANVTMAGGFGHLQKGHGVSFSDIDNDGDQDVYVQLGGAYAGDRFNDALFENPGFGNNSVTIKCEGTQTNRCAIGVRIKLHVNDGGTERDIYHHVTSGGSFGANPFRQVIGIGAAESIDRLEIYWPTSDTTQVFEDVHPNQAYRIVEGRDELELMELKPMKIGGSG